MTPEDIEQASRSWPRTKGGQKVFCPDCGMTGYPEGSWTHKHRFHDNCPTCGKTVSSQGLAIHRHSHRKQAST